MKSCDITLTPIAEKLPEANTLVWCRRRDGRLILAVRNNKPISTNPDPSRDCHWYGQNRDKGLFTAGRGGIGFNLSFSDITVDGWAYV